MEENEQDLEKLALWLAKIQARDFFPDERRQQAAGMMARCRSAMNGFSQAVYIAEGVQEVTDDGATWAPAALESTEADAAPTVAPGARTRRGYSGIRIADTAAVDSIQPA